MRRAMLIGGLLMAAAVTGCTLFAQRIDDLAFVALTPIHDGKTRDTLRLTFRGDADLRHAGNGTGAWAYISLCPFHDDPFVGIGHVANIEAGAPFTYDVDFVYDGTQHESFTDKFGGRELRSIALPGGPQDLCVKVHGDSGPPGFVSNEFRIPKAALVNALRP